MHLYNTRERREKEDDNLWCGAKEYVHAKVYIFNRASQAFYNINRFMWVRAQYRNIRAPKHFILEITGSIYPKRIVGLLFQGVLWACVSHGKMLKVFY